MQALNSRHVTSPKGASLLRVLSSFVLCRHCAVKEHQDLVRTLIQGNENTQAILREVLLFLNESRRHSDLTSNLLTSENKYTLETQAAYLSLLSDLCEGKASASSLYVERLVPWSWLVQNCTRHASQALPAVLDQGSPKALGSNAFELLSALQAAHLTFMRKVYIGNNTEHLCPLFSSSTHAHDTCGILSTDAQKGLFPALVSQTREFLNSFESWPPPCVKVLSLLALLVQKYKF